jgi:putative spermidine/putrescine transport system substrate-binding protein
MKKITAIVAMIAVSVSMMAGCAKTKPTTGTNSTEQKTFTLYSTGSQNVEEMWKKIIPKFEAKFPQYKVKHVHVPAGSTSNQALTDKIYAAKQAGKDPEMDIMELGLNDLVRGNQQGLWHKFTESEISNLKNVNDQYRRLSNDFAINHRASSVVLAYNSEKVPNPPKTASELYDWIKKNPEKFAYNDPSTGGSGDSFVQTAVYNQLPDEAFSKSDPSVKAQWQKGLDLLKDLGKYVYGKGIYPKKNQGTLDLLASGEIWMAPAWSDQVQQQVNAKTLPTSIKMAQIQPAFTGGPSYLMMSETTKNKDAALAFLNFILESEIQSMFVNDMQGYPGIKWELMPKEIYEKFKDVASGYRVANIGDLGKDLQKMWQEQVAAGN